jgi:hypothetical protein
MTEVQLEFWYIKIARFAHYATVCETKFCCIIDQSLFYIDLTVHYIQNFENLTYFT